MKLSILIVGSIGVILGILQSTMLSAVIPFGFVPDLALILLVAASWYYGSLPGEIAGFFIGLTFDIMSLAPLGFHSFIYTSVGYLYGKMQGSIAPGPVGIPVIAAGIATGIKYLGSFLLSLVFGLNSAGVRYFTLDSLFEFLANIVLSPLIFLLVALIVRVSKGRRGGFH
jgi:rod shape-determining protein MreD